jgi:hypothetical protein
MSPVLSGREVAVSTVNPLTASVTDPAPGRVFSTLAVMTSPGENGAVCFEPGVAAREPGTRKKRMRDCNERGDDGISSRFSSNDRDPAREKLPRLSFPVSGRWFQVTHRAPPWQRPRHSVFPSEASGNSGRFRPVYAVPPLRRNAPCRQPNPPALSPAQP